MAEDSLAHEVDDPTSEEADDPKYEEADDSKYQKVVDATADETDREVPTTDSGGAYATVATTDDEAIVEGAR